VSHRDCVTLDRFCRQGERRLAGDAGLRSRQSSEKTTTRIATIVSRMKRAIWILPAINQARLHLRQRENRYGTAEVMPVISTNVVQRSAGLSGVASMR
jgi:hypothetical protein